MRVKLGASELVELGRKCKAGEIVREGYRRSGYTRKDGARVGPARVGPSCVPDTGAPGKTPASKRILPQPKEGTLKGWEARKNDAQRHAALRKAVRAEGCRAVISRLSLERGFTKVTSPATAAAAKRDQEWLHDQGFCKLKTKNK